MKELIKKALDEAYVVLEGRTPLTKKEEKRSLSVIGSTLSELIQFSKESNIPADAELNGVNNGYDAFEDIVFVWDIDVPTTDKDKIKFKRDKFSTIAHKIVYDLLLANGYKKIGFNSGLLRDFDDTTVYDMYIAGDFDRLVKYYSISFVEI